MNGRATDKELREQIEQIIDEGDGPERHVIVRMKNPYLENTELVAACSDAIRRRALSTSAREVLPARLADALGRRSRSRAGSAGGAGASSRASQARRNALLPLTSARTLSQLAPANQSFLAQVSDVIPDLTVARLRTAGLKALDPLLRSAYVLAHAVDPKGDRATAAVTTAMTAAVKGTAAVSKHAATAIANGVLPLWTNSSAALRMGRDALAKLPEEVTEVEAVYVNRRLRVPRIAEARRLGAAVEENKTSAWGVQGINALAAWGAYGARGKGVKVAVLDTGVDATHPDLKDRLKGWAEFDADGRPVPGSKPHDTDKHGTHCSGTICGGNASGRFIGVAPEADLYCALVLNGEEGGTDAQVQAGMQWAVEQGVDVISMSLGGLTIGAFAPDTYTDQIVNALRVGIPVVTAIGNEGSQTSGSPGNDLFAFAVGAVDVYERAAGFSGGCTQIIRSSRYLDPAILPLPYSKPEVCAPGVAVLSSVPDGKWEAFNGTSMATPHVAGAIALILSATDIRESVDAGRRAILLQDLLTGSVKELGEAGQNHRFGFGRIDVLSAIGFAKELGY